MQALSVIEETTRSFSELVALLKQKDEHLLREKSSHQPWSIFDILEHLMIVDDFRISELKKALTHPSSSEAKDGDSGFSYEELLQKASDRQTKVQAPDYSIPKGELKSITAFDTAFQENRRQMRAIIENNDGDILASTKLAHARLGWMNVKEWIVYLCGHGEKHEQQIKEILHLR